MSTPRNHHYVSQVLTRKFLNHKGQLHIYNKTKDEFRVETSTRYLFSQQDLNASIAKDGTLNYSEVEEQLNRHFETGFNKHYERIVTAGNMRLPIGTAFPNPEELHESFEYLAKMALIGDMRTPYHMEDAAASIYGPLFHVAQHMNEELKAQIYGSYNHYSRVTNKTPVDFKKVSDKVWELMGDKVVSVHQGPPDCFYLLPDCSSCVIRAQLEEDNVIDGKTFYNPQRPIASANMPINSRMIIGANSGKVMRSGMGNGFYTLDRQAVYLMNKLFFEVAHEEVVCENEKYLRKFVAKYKRQESI